MLEGMAAAGRLDRRLEQASKARVVLEKVHPPDDIAAAIPAGKQNSHSWKNPHSDDPSAPSV